jgi:hypothetical protein
MKRIILSAVLLLGGVLHASADDYFTFKDIKKPHGHERSHAAGDVDGRKCGMGSNGVFADAHAFTACMRARGWAVANVAADPLPYDNSVTFDDIRAKPDGRRRGDADLHADSRLCDPSGTTDPLSPRFKRCMLGYGWRFYAYVPPAQSPIADDDDDSSPPDMSMPDHSHDNDAALQAQSEAADAMTVQGIVDSSNALAAANAQNFQNFQPQ